MGCHRAKDLNNAKPKIKKGDIVIVNTGWHQYFPSKSYDFFNYYPGFYTEAAEWFVEHEVKMVGIDGGRNGPSCAHRPLDKYAPGCIRSTRRLPVKTPTRSFLSMNPVIWRWPKPISPA